MTFTARTRSENRSAITVDTLVSRVHPAYQPVVDLYSHEVAGFEALARWPGLDIEVGQAFSLAAAAGRLAELDRACARAAMRGGLDAGLDSSKVLFVNAEPETLRNHPPPASEAAAWLAGSAFRAVIEVTERDVLQAPGDLLRGLDRVRRRGAGVALDDVGAVPASLAVMPLVAPDIIKLDIGLVQGRRHIDAPAVVTALLDHAERTGAVIVAEGIETEAHLRRALAYGATLGQGWYFGHPGPLMPSPACSRPLPFLAPPSSIDRAFEDLVGWPPSRVAHKATLVSLSKHLEQEARDDPLPRLVLASFQSQEDFTPSVQARYQGLAGACALVVALGRELGRANVPGVRTLSVDPSGQHRDEWSVITLGAHSSSALVAEDLGDDGPDSHRRFAYTLTHNRDLAAGAARRLLDRTATPSTIPAPRQSSAYRPL